MSEKPVPEVPFREEDAERVLASITDPIVRNLVQLCVARARARFMRPTNVSEAEWRKQLPAEPFDLAFFASILAQAFSRREMIERVLRGESIATASGWDV